MCTENKLKHLEFIQSVVDRMARNSFYLKGWSVTLVAAIFVLATKDGNPGLVPVAYLPAIVFWFLDAYFLRQERLFRKLYDATREKPAGEIDFSMDTEIFTQEVAGYFAVMGSITLRWFHGVIVLVVFVTHMLTLAI